MDMMSSTNVTFHPFPSHAGIATHFIQSSLLEDVQRSLQNVNNTESIAGLLDTFAPDTLEPFSLGPLLPTIKECFSPSTVHEIMERVKGHQQSSNSSISTWAKETCAQLDSASPAALMVLMKRDEFHSLGHLDDAQKGMQFIFKELSSNGNRSCAPSHK